MRNNRKVNQAKQKLLIIDDDEASRLLIVEILSDGCTSIIEAKCGKEALFLFKKYSEELALVFLDIKLPDCSGWELISQFRSENYSVPIIAISATNPNELKERCEVAGFDSYLSKPFDIKDMEQIAEFYLKQKSISI